MSGGALTQSQYWKERVRLQHPLLQPYAFSFYPDTYPNSSSFSYSFTIRHPDTYTNSDTKSDSFTVSDTDTYSNTNAASATATPATPTPPPATPTPTTTHRELHLVRQQPREPLHPAGSTSRQSLDPDARSDR